MTHILAARPSGMGETGWVGSWSPGIGDPTILGWVTVVAYFAAAWLCYRVIARLKRHKNRGTKLVFYERLLWQGFFTLLIVLGINKQLDLQSAFTEFFRQLAHEQGWYEDRRLYQRSFIETLLVLGAIAGATLVAATWRLPSPTKIAGLGLGFVGCYVLIRASSLHQMDRLIGAEIFSMRLNWLFELGGLGVVGFGAQRRATRMKLCSKMAHDTATLRRQVSPRCPQTDRSSVEDD